MTSIQDIIKLAKLDNGKFFVMDETGEIKLVVMSIEDYEKVLLGKLVKTSLDIEDVNQEIIKAQLTDTEDPIEPIIVPEIKLERVDLRSEVIDPSFNFDGPEEKDEQGV